jgi:hypothetical protein
MDFYNDFFSKLVFNNDISTFEIIKWVTSGLGLFILFPICKWIKKKYEAAKAKKERVKEIENELQKRKQEIIELEKRVINELKYIIEQLSSKDVKQIISNDKLSETNVLDISKYCLYLKEIGDSESNDYISIKNLFIKSEDLKKQLRQYISIRSGGTNQAIKQDPAFGNITKNYNELNDLIEEKINKLSSIIISKELHN